MKKLFAFLLLLLLPLAARAEIVSQPPGSGGGGGTGTVTSFSCVTANGVSCTVANATTTPAATFTLGAITPTTVNGLTISTSTGTVTIANAKTLTASNTLTFSGTDGSSVNFGAGGTVLYSGGAVTSLTGDSVLYSNSASTGAVTLTPINESANTVFAGPTSGGSAAPAFRALVAADIPAASTIALGTSAAATNPQRSSQAGTGLYSDTTNVIQVAAGGVKVQQWNATASAVDYLNIIPAATANPATVQMNATGSDSNINLSLGTVGSGGVTIGTTTQGSSVGNKPALTVAGSNATEILVTDSSTFGAAIVLQSTHSGGNTWQFQSSTNGGFLASIPGGNTGFQVTSNGVYTVGSGGVYGLSSTSSAGSSGDTGFSRGSAGVLDIGTGTSGSIAGTIIGLHAGFGGVTSAADALDAGNSNGLAFNVTPTASEIDYVNVTGGVTGNPGTATISALGSDTNVYLKLLSKGTGTVQIASHKSYLGTAPAVSSCGTSPSIDANATDNSGTVTVGTGTAASCTVTFNVAYTNFVHCRVTSQTTLAAFGYTYTKTAITVTGTSLVGDLFDYECDGQ